jgi:phosphoglycerate dehydrogenase-like enzyme
MADLKPALFLVDYLSMPLEEIYDEEAMHRLGGRLDLLPGVFSSADLAAAPERFRDVRIVLSTWGMPALSDTVLEQRLPRLEAVFYAAGSVQEFARPLLTRGIRLFSAWAANAVPVAEFTVAQILLAGKGYHQSLRRTKQDYRASREYSMTFPGNYGIKVGILGAGQIGSLVIDLLKRHALEVLVFDPFLDEARAAALGVRKCGLDEIFATCRTISNHLANKPETRGLLNGALFDRMLPNATFLNTGRGAQVVEEDLFRALEAEPGRTAILDATDPEPPVDLDRFQALDNVLLTPHIAGSMNQECRRMGLYMAEEVERYLDGVPLRWEVTPERLATMA